jgi:hypothetical protein
MLSVELDVPEPLRDCFLHCEVICVRECCGIDAISEDPELVVAWSRQVGHQSVLKALNQVEVLIAQVQDLSRKVILRFLNAAADGEVTRERLLSFLQAFEAALRSRPVNEILTRAEMEAQFDGEWVLVADPELDKNLEVLKGLVVSHGQDPEEVYQAGIDLGVTRSASLYFGPIPEMSILLNLW